jgi:hypothetical protein
LEATLTAAEQDPEPAKILARADELLARLRGALQEGALLLVLSGQGDTPLCRALHGEGSHRKERGPEAQQLAARRAQASREVRELAQRAQQGTCLAWWNHPAAPQTA